MAKKGLLQRILTWADPDEPQAARAFSDSPIDIVPFTSQYFGPGIQFQPQAARLLAENIGIAKVASRAIADRIAGLEINVKQVISASKGTIKEVIIDDHVLKMVLDRPHPNFSRSKLFGLCADWILTVGEAYLQKVRNGINVPVELHPVPPSMVEPIIVRNIVQQYLITDANGTQYRMPANEIVRSFRPDPQNPWRAEGYLGPAGIATDTHRFASEHLRSHFQNDATPRMVLEAQEGSEGFDPPELDRFYERWRQYNRHRGGARPGLPVILPYMMHAVQLAMQSGQDIVPVLTYYQEQLLMTYRVPASVLGKVVSGDRSSAETNQWVFDRYAVKPIVEMLEDDLTYQLAADFDSKIVVRFEDFIGEDKDFALRKRKQDLETKMTTVNIERESDGLDPVDWGDEPIGTPQDVPYDPEAAATRVNRPPAPPPQPAAAPVPPTVHADEDDDFQRMEKDLQAKIRILARKARENKEMNHAV